MQNYVNYSLLAESVKALLGKHVKILLKNVVKLETKQDKQENRVLVSNFCSLSVFILLVHLQFNLFFFYLRYFHHVASFSYRPKYPQE